MTTQRVQLDDSKLRPGPAAAEGATPQPVPAAAATESAPVEIDELERRIVEALKTCYDPEIPVNIYELGLIYEVDIDEGRNVALKMTLTSPMCPVAGTLPGEVESKVRRVPGVTSAKVEVVWSPPWSPDQMTEAAKLQLGLF